jgi:hypothetical protein
LFIAQLFASICAIEVHCDYRYHNWAIIDRVYQCNVTSIEIISENQTITKLIGSHEKGKHVTDVLGLYIFGKKCFYFPENVHKFLTNLEGIVIGFAGLKKITNKDLRKAPKLQILMLPNNEIEVLEKDLFEFNPHLKAFVVNHNKIKHIEPGLFSIKILSKIFLYKNTCIDSVAVSKEQKQELEAAVLEFCPPKKEEIVRPAVKSETQLMIERMEGRIAELEDVVVKRFDLLFKQLDNIEKTVKTMKLKNSAVINSEVDMRKNVTTNKSNS